MIDRRKSTTKCCMWSRRNGRNINQINSDIEEHQKLLEDAKYKLTELNSKSTELIREKTSHEEQIVDTIIEEFSISIALKLASEDSLQELIDNEIYTLLSQYSKEKVSKLNTNYSALSTNTKNNQKDIDKIASYIEDRQKTKNKLTVLKEKHSSSLISLEEQHKSYQEELNKVAKEQESLKNLLSELNILKEAETKKAQAREEAEAEEKRRKLQDLLAMKKSSNQKVTQEESSSEPLDDDVRLQDPHLALYGGEDGLDCYRAILATLRPYCDEKTICLFEIGYQQREVLTYLLADWRIHNVHLDNATHPRVVRFGV